MLSAAEWFATNELQNVRDILDKHPGYNLVLTGHSLGAGTACLLAHWIKNKPEAA
jgi:putative lipase involved disintegration of autophagic bodies